MKVRILWSISLSFWLLLSAKPDCKIRLSIIKLQQTERQMVLDVSMPILIRVAFDDSDLNNTIPHIFQKEKRYEDVSECEMTFARVTAYPGLDIYDRYCITDICGFLPCIDINIFLIYTYMFQTFLPTRTRSHGYMYIFSTTRWLTVGWFDSQTSRQCICAILAIDAWTCEVVCSWRSYR